ncbi:hypothetical protein V1289_003641 [Bradyrhizobium sp. AZCC 2289]
MVASTWVPPAKCLKFLACANQPSVISRRHEATEVIATVVQAALRLRPAGVPRAAGRLRRAARARSGPGRGDQGQDLRWLPAHRSAQEDRKAGHHCRYRRQEHGKARTVAMAADADRGSRRGADQARRCRDRLRRGVFRARPPQSRCRGRHVPQSRRRNPRQVAGAAEQRSDFRRCHQRVARGAGRIGAAGRTHRTRQDPAGDGAGDAGRGAAATVHVRFPGPAAQCRGPGACRGRAWPVYDQSRTGRHRAAGADDYAGPKA